MNRRPRYPMSHAAWTSSRGQGQTIVSYVVLRRDPRWMVAVDSDSLGKDAFKGHNKSIPSAFRTRSNTSRALLAPLACHLVLSPLPLLSLLHIRHVHVEHRAGSQKAGIGMVRQYRFHFQECEYRCFVLAAIRPRYVLLFGQFHSLIKIFQ